MNNLDRRYENQWGSKGRSWNLICRDARSLTNNRCTLNPRHRATQVHHAYYRRRFGWLGRRLDIAGVERPGVDVFPLCDECHIPIAHHRDNWIQYEDQGDNHNTREFIAKLRWRHTWLVIAIRLGRFICRNWLFLLLAIIVAWLGRTPLLVIPAFAIGKIVF